MQTATITQRLREAIGGRDVVHAVFTTYTFEPDFFELEILPALFSGDFAYSPSGIYRREQLEQQLLETGLHADIYYDATIFDGASSPLLEYRTFGVDLSPYAFHAKLVVLLVNDPATGNQSIILGAGSNNIAEAAWLTSIECCHFTELGLRRAPPGILQPLQDALRFLASLRPGVVSEATDAIAGYLQNLSPTREEPEEWFYFQRGGAGSGFLPFLKDRVGRCSDLEIVSPFFPDSEESDLHLELKEGLKAKSCRILLPLDPHQDGSPALATRGFYQHVRGQKLKGVNWGDWDDRLQKALDAGQPRGLHAKLFVMHTARMRFIFSGSVNFSRRAFQDNVEAGFLVRDTAGGTLLKPLKQEPVQFLEKAEPAPGESPEQARTKLNLYCSYDWLDKTASFSASADCVVELVGAALQTVLGPVTPPLEGVETVTLTAMECQELERLLINTSLLRSRLRFADKEEPEVRWIVVQQINTIYRPSRIPPYSVMEILSLYTTPTVVRRMRKVEESAARGGFDLWQDADENCGLEPETPPPPDMFGEFSRIHTAFRQIRKRIRDTREKGMLSQVDYFLMAERPDSIKGLLAALPDAKETTPVAQYLILLSCIEVLAGNLDRPGVDRLCEGARMALSLLKESGRIVIGELAPERFFGWYEQEFFGGLDAQGTLAGGEHV